MLVVKIDLSYIAPLARATVNGLILLAHKFPGRRHQQLLICNPITREFLTIPNPPHHISFNFKFLTTQLRRTPSYGAHENGNYIYGFGVSRRSNEYKLVWDKLWMNTECAFLGGNLYWLDPDMGASRFWCLDLETEVFTAFSAPCQPPQGCVRRLVCVLEERLCLCDVVVVEGGYDEIEMWLMSNEELGDWWKEYEIREGYWMRLHGYLFPIKVLEDGGMLFGRVGEPEILWYSPKYSSFRGASSNSLWLLYPHDWSLVRDASRRDWCPTAAHYTPSFLPLKTLFPDMDIRTLSPDMDTIQPCSRRWTTAPSLPCPGHL